MVTRSIPTHLGTAPRRCSRRYRSTSSQRGLSYGIADCALPTLTQAETHRHPEPPSGTTWSAIP